MAYRVVKAFADSQDNGRIYQVGDAYPRPDFAVTDARLSVLASSSNAIGIPLIEKIENGIEKEPAATPTRGRPRKKKEQADA